MVADFQHEKTQPKISLKPFVVTSPSASNTAAQTKAETQFAIWKRQNGISKMPATSGTEARNGPEKRPMKMPSGPHFLMKASPFGIRSGYLDNGQTCCTVYSSLRPIQ